MDFHDLHLKIIKVAFYSKSLEDNSIITGILNICKSRTIIGVILSCVYTIYTHV